MCVASHATPTTDLACYPGMCPDWELNQQLFGSQGSTQSTEPHQPGLKQQLRLHFPTKQISKGRKKMKLPIWQC